MDVFRRCTLGFAFLYSRPQCANIVHWVSVHAHGSSCVMWKPTCLCVSFRCLSNSASAHSAEVKVSADVGLEDYLHTPRPDSYHLCQLCNTLCNLCHWQVDGCSIQCTLGKDVFNRLGNSCSASTRRKKRSETTDVIRLKTSSNSSLASVINSWFDETIGGEPWCFLFTARTRSHEENAYKMMN